MRDMIRDMTFFSSSRFKDINKMRRHFPLYKHGSSTTRDLCTSVTKRQNSHFVNLPSEESWVGYWSHSVTSVGIPGTSPLYISISSLNHHTQALGFSTHTCIHVISLSSKVRRPIHALESAIAISDRSFNHSSNIINPMNSIWRSCSFLYLNGDHAVYIKP